MVSEFPVISKDFSPNSLKIFGKAERNLDDDDIVSLSEDIDEEKYNQVKWIYDYRDDYDEFVDENGEVDKEKRDEIGADDFKINQ